MIVLYFKKWFVGCLSLNKHLSCDLKAPLTSDSVSDTPSIGCSIYQSKKEGKDQESIQPSTTPDPGYQWERNVGQNIMEQNIHAIF